MVVLPVDSMAVARTVHLKIADMAVEQARIIRVWVHLGTEISLITTMDHR